MEIFVILKKYDMAVIEEKNKIKASPTKNLFISMLVKDITLADAIGDLIDNSVDGAKQMRPAKNYKGLIIEIKATPSHFIIKDNCGGIEAAIARNYAFRFGRPKDKPIQIGSVGQFGIGMKRSLFKMGKRFEINTIAALSSFKMEVDVDNWQNDEASWDFEFNELNEGISNDEKSRKTEITVTNLNIDIKEQFESQDFIKKLFKEIELENIYNITNGLQIRINDHSLKARKLELIESESIKIGFFEKVFDDGLSVKLYAGIGESVLEDGGWYMFCNDRLIVGPEQTELSGWTGSGGDGGPNYHGQYQRFRGYAFFNSQDSSLLPWNTTKNGMDRDSPRFKYIRMRMIDLMKPVITFLNQMKKEREKDSSPEERPLEQLVENSTITSISDYNPENLSAAFSFPQVSKVSIKQPELGKITYSVPISKIKKVMKCLGAKSYKEVGEGTFDYYYEMEIGEK
jgi:hypothetical protein